MPPGICLLTGQSRCLELPAVSKGEVQVSNAYREVLLEEGGPGGDEMWESFTLRSEAF